MTKNATITTGISDGYKCEICGMWVAPSTLHTCGGYRPAQVTIAPDPTQVRIAVALERIAAALEKEAG